MLTTLSDASLSMYLIPAKGAQNDGTLSEPSREPAQPSEFDRHRGVLHPKVKIDDLKAEQDKSSQSSLRPDANVEPTTPVSWPQVRRKIEGFVGLHRQRRVKRTPDVERAVEILTELGMFEECNEFCHRPMKTRSGHASTKAT